MTGRSRSRPPMRVLPPPLRPAALLQLAELTDEPTRAQRYREYAHTILITLCSLTFLAMETPGWEGILKHGIHHQRKNLGVDESVMWGEYFFVEALDHLGQLTGNSDPSVALISNIKEKND